VLRTLSKLGLAGLRLGYACADPAWIGEFDKLRPPYNVGVLPLAAADFLLDHFSGAAAPGSRDTRRARPAC